MADVTENEIAVETKVPILLADNLESGQVTTEKSPKAREPVPEGMSRNAWKREQKRIKWEEQKDQRNKYKKEKKKEKKALSRLQREQEGTDKPSLESQLKHTKKTVVSRQVPITILLDCAFDDMMTSKEQLSLSLQVVRSYSENRRAVFPVKLAISSLNGTLKERFEGPLKAQYKQWKGVDISFDPYVVPELPEERANFIYLSSDAEETLETLDENKTYIVGGIVDKGRYKSLCYNKANSQNIRTAKLPISEFIKISGRQVLATNHVVEIMLKWLEHKDWKIAFEQVIPPRKQEGFESARVRQKRKREEYQSQGGGDSTNKEPEANEDNSDDPNQAERENKENSINDPMV
ncbi:guanine-1-methyltransferase-domain-containing protein [Lipomyces japonicus]|uniref:guanine-1-methyltransferase-domain-containing protein n=1 Tax=Lipomyces japonicus TaxID=56871 RepID=UPI0034CF9221